MIIKPYSDIAAEAFNAADFPALKHFWACKQGVVAAGGTILDLAGTAHLTITAGAAVSGNGLSVPAASHVPASTLTPPGTGSCILIASGTWGGTSNGFIYGSTTLTGGLSLGTVSVAARAFNTGIPVKTVAGGASAVQTAGDFTRVTTYRSVASVPTELMSFEVSSANGYTLDTYDAVADLTAATAITDIPAVAQTVQVTTATNVIFGAAFFKFSGALPPKEQIMAMAAWCDYQWRNNSNPTMYPGFKGLA